MWTNSHQLTKTVHSYLQIPRAVKRALASVNPANERPLPGVRFPHVNRLLRGVLERPAAGVRARKRTHAVRRADARHHVVYDFATKSGVVFGFVRLREIWKAVRNATLFARTGFGKKRLQRCFSGNNKRLHGSMFSMAKRCARVPGAVLNTEENVPAEIRVVRFLRRGFRVRFRRCAVISHRGCQRRKAVVVPQPARPVTQINKRVLRQTRRSCTQGQATASQRRYHEPGEHHRRQSDWIVLGFQWGWVSHKGFVERIVRAFDNSNATRVGHVVVSDKLTTPGEESIFPSDCGPGKRTRCCQEGTKSRHFPRAFHSTPPPPSGSSVRTGSASRPTRRARRPRLDRFCSKHAFGKRLQRSAFCYFEATQSLKSLKPEQHGEQKTRTQTLSPTEPVRFTGSGFSLFYFLAKPKFEFHLLWGKHGAAADRSRLVHSRSHGDANPTKAGSKLT